MKGCVYIPNIHVLKPHVYVDNGMCWVLVDNNGNQQKVREAIRVSVVVSTNYSEVRSLDQLVSYLKCILE